MAFIDFGVPYITCFQSFRVCGPQKQRPPFRDVVQILCRAKSFLGPPELLTTYKAFVCRLMEYCSPFWAGPPASYLSRLHAVETKAFMIIGISRNEAESLGLSLSHRRQVGGLSLIYRLLSGLAHPALSAICPHHIYAGTSRSANNPLLVKLPKSRITAHLHSFIPLFSAFGINPLTLFNPILPSRSSKPVHHHLLSSPIQILDLFYPR